MRVWNGDHEMWLSRPVVAGQPVSRMVGGAERCCYRPFLDVNRPLSIVRFTTRRHVGDDRDPHRSPAG